jgi:hypothetical protein
VRYEINTACHLDEHRPYGWGGQSPAFHRGCPCLIPGQCLRHLWLTKWHCDRFVSQYLFPPVSTIPPLSHTHADLRVAITRRTRGRSLVTFRKAMLFRNCSSFGWQIAFTFFYEPSNFIVMPVRLKLSLSRLWPSASALILISLYVVGQVLAVLLSPQWSRL